MACQSSLISFSLIDLQKVVNSFGPNFVTSFTIVTRIKLLIQHPFTFSGAAVATYTEQNIGAGKYYWVKPGFIKVIICSSFFAIIIFIIFQNFAQKIVRIFGDDPIVEKYSIVGLKITCSFYVFLGFIHVSRNVLNGSGDIYFCLVMNLLNV